MKLPNKSLPIEVPSRLLGSVVEFMVMAGLSESAIRRSFDSALRRVRPKDPRSRLTGQTPEGDVTAHLLRIWHRDERYVDKVELKPKPLYLSRGRTSLRSMLMKLDPAVDVAATIRAMRDNGLIRRTKDGRYLPTARAAVLQTPHPWAVEHAAQSVLRLLATVSRNVSATPGVPPLLERYSYVPDLDPDEAHSFAEFARRQGQVLLDTLDDWLEVRRAKETVVGKAKRRVGIPAGLHLITFVGE